MIGDSKTHEWNSLKEQFALLVRAETVRADDAEVLLDVEFQRRLAEGADFTTSVASARRFG
jgi:hypothetical protein